MTAARCARRYARWMDSAFVGDLPARRWRLLRAHLEACGACRARFERLLFAARGLTPGVALSRLEIDLIGREVQARSLPPRRRAWRWAAGIGAAAAAAGAALVLLVAGPALRDSGLRPRGAGRAFDGRPPGARVFCVGADAAGVRRVESEARATEPPLPVPTLRCNIAGRLQIAYSTPSLEGLTMVAYSRDAEGRNFWYAPRQASDPAVPVAADVVARPLDWSTTLAVKHHPGGYDLRILFFDRAVTAEDAAAGRAAPIQTLSLRLEVEEVRR